MLKEVLCSRCFSVLPFYKMRKHPQKPAHAPSGSNLSNQVRLQHLIGQTAFWFSAFRFQTQPTRQLISKHESSHVTSVRIVFLESSCSFQKQRVALDAQMSTLYKMSCCFLQAWILSACVSCGSVLEQHLLRRRRGPSFTNLPQCYT